jgi:hypothetical protein
MRLVERGGDLVVYSTLPGVRQALLSVLDPDILILHSLIDVLGLLVIGSLSVGALDLLPRLLLRLLLERLDFGSLFLRRLSNAATATLMCISMADIGLSLPIVEGTSSPKRRMLKELIRISVANISLLRLVFDSTGILVA